MGLSAALSLTLLLSPPLRRLGLAGAMTVRQVSNRIALLQFQVTSDKVRNLQTAQSFLQQACDAGARLSVLPECWNSPYATSAFGDYAERVPSVGDADTDTDTDGCCSCTSWGPSSQLLMDMARKTNMYIIGGSIPEEDTDKKLYNTCVVVDPRGVVVAKHRKLHLFDIDVPGGIRFCESETLTGGQTPTYFDVDGDTRDDNQQEEKPVASAGLGRVGIGICYDIRFPEYALLLTQVHNCKILIFPGAFNLTTGPAHWELLQRARAVDGQCYVATVSPARTLPPVDTNTNTNLDDETIHKQYPHYSAWGHSTVVSPWGDVIATCEEGPAMVVVDLDMTKVDYVRTAIPTMKQKRLDLYRLISPGQNDCDRID